MKKYGKILKFDKYVGTIIDRDGIKYMFTSKDLLDKSIVEGDFVSFNAEVFETVEIKEYIAKFIKKANVEETKLGD